MSYSIYRDTLQAEGAELLCSRQKDFIRISCSDYVIFDVDRDAFEQSVVVTNLLSDLSQHNQQSMDIKGQPSHRLNIDPIEIPFCACDFKRCLDYNREGSAVSPPMSAEDIVMSWRIADYFHMQALKDNLIVELGNILRADSMSAVRRRLCVKNDYTTEEEEQMRLEELDVSLPEGEQI